MPLGLAILLIVLISAAIVLGVIYLILWLLNRYVHRYASVGAGVLLIFYLVYSELYNFNYCNTEPRYVPPAPGEIGDGRMIFNCDSASGALDRLDLWATPIIILLIVLFLSQIIRRQSQTDPAGQEGSNQ